MPDDPQLGLHFDNPECAVQWGESLNTQPRHSWVYYLREKEGSGDCRTIFHGASSARLSARSWFFMEVSILKHSCAIWPNSPFLGLSDPTPHVDLLESHPSTPHAFPPKARPTPKTWDCSGDAVHIHPLWVYQVLALSGGLSEKQAGCYWFAMNCS